MQDDPVRRRQLADPRRLALGQERAVVEPRRPDGSRAVVWGQIRGTRPGRKTYRLEILRKNAWRPVGRARLTNDEGVFIRTIRLKRGALLRIWSPAQRRYSVQLRVR